MRGQTGWIYKLDLPKTGRVISSDFPHSGYLIWLISLTQGKMA